MPRTVTYTAPFPVYSVTDDAGNILDVGYTVDVQRYSFFGILRDVYLGLHYGFPLCCIASYVWWQFWHGAPAYRYWERHCDGRPDPDGVEFVPCHRHMKR